LSGRGILYLVSGILNRITQPVTWRTIFKLPCCFIGAFAQIVNRIAEFFGWAAAIGHGEERVSKYENNNRDYNYAQFIYSRHIIFLSDKSGAGRNATIICRTETVAAALSADFFGYVRLRISNVFNDVLDLAVVLLCLAFGFVHIAAGFGFLVAGDMTDGAFDFTAYFLGGANDGVFIHK
jgi:hypothetical protein